MSARASAAAVRANLARFRTHQRMVDKWGEPMVAAAASYLAELQGSERFLSLALPALQEALAPLDPLGQNRPRLECFLGLPEARPGTPLHLAEVMQSRLGGQVPLARIQVFARGHAAGLMALAEACQRLRHGEGLCMVGGVDTYLQPEALEWLDAQGLFKSPSQRWGFIPGEAASFCLLASEAAVKRHGLRTLGRILSVSVAHEERTRRAGGICLGEGLTRALSGALEALAPGRKVDQVIGDLNGERYRTDEYGFSLNRLSERFTDGSRIRTPADCWGDVGAASGPLFLILSAISAMRGYAPGPLALVWTSAEGGERAAALLELPIKPGGRAPWR
ncbi:beta-ketoacyl synthase N-terminal-like domain-containing protein [Archangium sp.]|uniref:beta-ketoacyl synthase N-terminal-like domain-containing protein n=1 Tax=Archangium sp. TaxID=1872627 RepID=UPI002D49E058|nr:beta-ketoacyl synthase N-terminal-like domain-containing protein [Archangium sp.]HYO56487.1 beta-ketoacyl synthase N-terminal-like domain-containing protein [Archangium sp.]